MSEIEIKQMQEKNQRRYFASARKRLIEKDEEGGRRTGCRARRKGRAH